VDYHPCKWVQIRPEIRYDHATHPNFGQFFNHKDELTMALETLFKFREGSGFDGRSPGSAPPRGRFRGSFWVPGRAERFRRRGWKNDFVSLGRKTAMDE
jgi:hypothetical protein